jgi:predicted cupin superfamily sugar epimerase
MQKYIDSLGLQPHPEGGFYKEVYRSEETIVGGERNLMTSIYFLLTSENISKFHRIKSDELWFHHAGSPLIVHTLDENGHKEHFVGSDFKKNFQPQFMVPKNTIFGSTVMEENSFSLVSCVVAPGFDFRDFELFSTESLLELFPNELEIIQRLS